MSIDNIHNLISHTLFTIDEPRENDNNLPSAKRLRDSENYHYFTDNSFSFTVISSQATIQEKQIVEEIDRDVEGIGREEDFAWLRLSEQSFAFWDNEEDAVYDNL